MNLDRIQLTDIFKTIPHTKLNALLVGLGIHLTRYVTPADAALFIINNEITTKQLIAGLESLQLIRSANQVRETAGRHYPASTEAFQSTDQQFLTAVLKTIHRDALVELIDLLNLDPSRIYPSAIASQLIQQQIPIRDIDRALVALNNILAADYLRRDEPMPTPILTPMLPVFNIKDVAHLNLILSEVDPVDLAHLVNLLYIYPTEMDSLHIAQAIISNSTPIDNVVRIFNAIDTNNNLKPIAEEISRVFNKHPALPRIQTPSPPLTRIPSPVPIPSPISSPVPSPYRIPSPVPTPTRIPSPNRVPSLPLLLPRLPTITGGQRVVGGSLPRLPTIPTIRIPATMPTPAYLSRPIPVTDDPIVDQVADDVIMAPGTSRPEAKHARVQSPMTPIHGTPRPDVKYARLPSPDTTPTTRLPIPSPNIKLPGGDERGVGEVRRILSGYGVAPAAQDYLINEGLDIYTIGGLDDGILSTAGIPIIRRTALLRDLNVIKKSVF